MKSEATVKEEPNDSTSKKTSEYEAASDQIAKNHEAEGFEKTSISESVITVKAENDDREGQQHQISKRARKRLEKKKQWEQTKKEKRAKEREKRKKRVVDDPNFVPRSKMRKMLKNKTMATSNCQMGIVVDLSFDEYMDEKSLAKCIKQVCRCYGINRRAENPVQYHITSNTGRSLTEMAKNIGYENWDVHFHDKNFTEVFDQSKIVYLTSESENIIEKVEDDKVYVIGGLVDHNKEKGLCHRLAISKGIAHGRLPIGEFIDMKTRKVLTIDHVFNILVNVVNGQAWKEAFLAVIPERKGAKAKDESDDESDPERG